MSFLQIKSGQLGPAIQAPMHPLRFCANRIPSFGLVILKMNKLFNPLKFRSADTRHSIIFRESL